MSDPPNLGERNFRYLGFPLNSQSKFSYVLSEESARRTRALGPILIYVFAVGLNLLGIAFVTGFSGLESGSDELEYYQRAILLYEEGRFEGLLRTPLWPWLISLVFHLTGPSIAAAKTMTALIGGLTPVGAMVLTAKLFGNRQMGLVVGLVAASLPSLLSVNVTLYAETATTAGFIWINILLVVILERAVHENGSRFCLRVGDWLVFGAALSLLLLIKPAFVPWVAMLVLCGFWRFRNTPRAFISAVALSTVAFCLVFAPWWVRNYEVSGGYFVPFSVAGGLTFAETNNPTIANMEPKILEIDGRRHWRGAGKALVDQHDSLGLASSDELNGLDEVSFARLLASRSYHWVLDHPGEFAKLAIKKIGYGFGVWPWVEQSLINYVMRILFLLVLLASLPGWVVILRNPGWHRLLLLHPVCFLILTVLFFGSWRYRNPFEASFVIVGIVGAWPWLSNWLHRISFLAPRRSKW